MPKPLAEIEEVELTPIEVVEAAEKIGEPEEVTDSVVLPPKVHVGEGDDVKEEPIEEPIEEPEVKEEPKVKEPAKEEPKV